MHSHLIPGIDDGSKSIEDSIFMLDELRKLGYSKCIVTPHIYEAYFPNTASSIKQGFETTITSNSYDGQMELAYAAEYFADEHLLAEIDAGAGLLEVSKGKVLVETSMIAEMPNFRQVLFKLRTNSYTPIIAHPERYTYFELDFERFTEFKRMGCELQVNLLSLSGFYGKKQLKLGIELIQKGLVDYLGTDLHHPYQLEHLKGLLGNYKVMRLLEAQDFKNSML